jgi:hypothetical protein
MDLEKALRPTRPQSRQFSDASTLYSDTTPTEQQTKVVQEPPHRLIQRHVRILRYLRYSIFTVYRRLVTVVFVLNVIGLLIILHHHHFWGSATITSTIATFASSNFLLAILARQDYLAALLFRTAWLVPWSAPLVVRNMAARVYCYGGIHSGAAIAGTAWWLAFTALTTWDFVRQASPLSVSILAWAVLLLLCTIVVLAHPGLRAKHHNTFELTHRLLGWLSVALFWVQVLLVHMHKTSPTRTMGSLLLHDPTFYTLSCLTLLLIYPWLHLRRHTFTPDLLSPHALSLAFAFPVHKFSCLSISTSPLCEWHPFATFPSATGSSIVVSRAGDWTADLIARAAQSPRKTMAFWIKSHPRPGVLSLSLLFPRVLILTTGSGIGPALSSLLERPASQHARLIWCTRTPLATYGQGILDLVHRADADAVVVDSDKLGRPDLLEVCLRVGREERVDAVFVLSNEGVVKWVVGGLEKMGVRAYGPIWDS